MQLVIDIGNTRIKWAEVNEDLTLQPMQACLHEAFEESELLQALSSASKVIIANVSDAKYLQQLVALAPPSAKVFEVKACAVAANVFNRYQAPQTLGIDRWAALVAAWDLVKQPTVVVSAGTAVTIDALARDTGAKGGAFIGGMIMPGLQMMQDSLTKNTARLKVNTSQAQKNNQLTSQRFVFPTNTQDAIEGGCMNAVVGAILQMLYQLEKHSAYLPRLIVTGGDADKIAEALKPQLKRVVTVDNLVLQGIVMLAK